MVILKYRHPLYGLSYLDDHRYGFWIPTYSILIGVIVIWKRICIAFGTGIKILELQNSQPLMPIIEQIEIE